MPRWNTTFTKFERGMIYIKRLVLKEIWHPAVIAERNWRGRGFIALRVLLISLAGLRKTNIASRAAALSYSSLLALGPVVAIIFMVSGFILDRGDDNLAVEFLNRSLSFIAPQVGVFEGVASEDTEAGAFNPQLVDLINQFIASSQSGAVGLVGTLILIVIAIQLLTTIEGAFNEIWGIARGRSWFNRVVLYWTVLSLGAVLLFSFIGYVSAGTLGALFDRAAENQGLFGLGRLLTPVLTFLAIVFLLALFYRVIPNTNVRIVPALSGAFLVTCLLFLNNMLAFLYVQRVITSKNLYGSVGILAIIMIGLFVFWFFILLGAQLTYSIQNVNHLSNQRAWQDTSPKTREVLTLLVFLVICRRFLSCERPYTSTELADATGAPGQIINEALSRLTSLGYVTTIPPDKHESAQAYRYQPARPLGKITLAGFKKALDEAGNTEALEFLSEMDPVAGDYVARISSALDQALGTKSVESLLADTTASPARERP